MDKLSPWYRILITFFVISSVIITGINLNRASRMNKIETAPVLNNPESNSSVLSTSLEPAEATTAATPSATPK